MGNQENLDEFTSQHWAGDFVPGFVLQQIGIFLTWGWPSVQGGNPTTMDFTQVARGKKLWCHLAVTYHHITQDIAQGLWDFERKWVQEKASEHLPIRHADIFIGWVLPRLSSNITSDRYNESDKHRKIQVPEEQLGVEELDICRARCADDDSCL